jgi:hypothetical protein
MSKLNSMNRILAGSATILLFLLSMTSGASAQQTTGTIVGTVADQTGAVVSGATVKATNVDTGFTRTATANSFGEYRIDFLPVGNYNVAVEAPTFKRFVQQNLDLTVDQMLTVEVKLSAGASTETITVTTAPPEINTSNASLGRTPGQSKYLHRGLTHARRDGQ